MSKKIVILSLHLGIGGAEKVICNLANLLSDNNDVKIISTYRLAENPAFNVNNKVKIEHFNIILSLKELYKSFKILYLRKYLMINAIKSLDCDIAISTRIFHNKLLGKYGNKNIIKIAQEHNHHNNNQKYIKKVINSLKNFDYFMPVSKELADFYKNKIQNTEVVYIPNFIEKTSNKISSLENKQLISVGRLEKVKGFDDLIDIFNIFYQTHKDWVLHIVGDGSEKQSLQNKIDNLNLNNNIFLCGNKLLNELENEYLNSSMYLMTSHSESFGIVLVEAASFRFTVNCI